MKRLVVIRWGSSIGKTCVVAMAGLLLACIALSPEEVRADGYAHDTHWYHQNGHYYHPSLTGSYYRTQYYVDGYYYYGRYYPGYYTYKYYANPVVVTPGDIEAAKNAYDLARVRDADMQAWLKSRGIQNLPAAGYQATLTGQYQQQIGQPYTANTTSATDPVIDVMAVLNMIRATGSEFRQLSGQNSSDLSDLGARVVQIVEFREAARALALVKQAQPAQTTFRQFQLQIQPATGLIPAQLTPVVPGGDGAVFNDARMKAGIAAVQSCVECHKGTENGRFVVTDIFQLPHTTKDGSLSFSDVIKRLTTEEEKKPRMPKGKPALTPDKMDDLQSAYIRAREIGIPLKQPVMKQAP